MFDPTNLAYAPTVGTMNNRVRQSNGDRRWSDVSRSADFGGLTR